MPLPEATSSASFIIAVAFFSEFYFFHRLLGSSLVEDPRVRTHRLIRLVIFLVLMVYLFAGQRAGFATGGNGSWLYNLVIKLLEIMIFYSS